MSLKSSCWFAAALLLACSAGFSETVTSDVGWTLSVDPAHGDYTLQVKDPAWEIGGTLGKRLTDAKAATGHDGAGDYRAIRFQWDDAAPRTGSIRIYQSRPLAIFSVTFVSALDHSPTPFPILTRLPENLLSFRYGETDHLRPLAFHLGGLGENDEYGGPFALFDTHANAMIVSPASDFMIAQLSGDAKQGISSGLNRTLQSAPAGYTYQTILAVDRGINHTWDQWGHGLTDLYGKKRPASDADAGLKYLGYWTDNGGTYYYNYDLDKGYAGTLLAVKAEFDKIGYPLHYMQLDSWWYPKTFNSVQKQASGKPRSKNSRIPAGTWNRYGGLLEYTAHPDLFPQGLGAFQKQLGLPLITHNRWIDPESPYRDTYKISGIAPIDPAWWEKIASDISSWGVATYEQDWNNYIYTLSPELKNTTWAGDAYMDGMANACAAHGLTMQYCMVLPRHLMQGGSKYPNLTTVRVSGDRFDQGKWHEFLYGSEMASALGVWPWTDVFRSSETPNMLICTLSAGMVGLADPIGAENIDNISRAVRRDGVIVKPDVPLTPVDATFIAEAQDQPTALVCATHTDHTDAGPAGDAFYIFAGREKQGGHGQTDRQPWSISPASLGMSGQIFAYDYFNGTGHLLSADQTISGTLSKDDIAYWVLAPVGPSGMALIGDPGKFVTRSKKRISEIRDNGARLSVTVLASESTVTLRAYVPAQPGVQVKNGTLNHLTYDPANKIATAEITVDPLDRLLERGPDGEIVVRVTFRR